MIDKKVLVIGAGGMLGSKLLSKLNFKNIIGYGSELDITNKKQVDHKLNIERPDIIIHTAAYTNVEEGEVNEDKSYLVNTIGTQNLVNYCINKDVLFVYLSSTGIYGETKDIGYTEFDPVIPTTVHHKSKYEGEKIVRNHCSKHLIIRTGWLYGGEKTHKKNFVYKRYLEAKKNNIVFSDDSQIGNPTYVIDLVKQIEKLIILNQYGVYNCVNKATQVSRYDYVKKIIQFFDEKAEVKIAPNAMYKRVAKVSKNESAVNYKLDLLGINVMGDWEKSLEKYINLLKS